MEIGVVADIKTALAYSAVRDWSRLNEGERSFWDAFLNEEVAPQHGFTPDPIRQLGTDYPWIEWVPKEVGDEVDKLLLRNKEGRLQAAALAAVRDGRIVLSVDPTARGVGKLIDELIAKWKCRRLVKRNGKSRVNAWLKVIAKFEDAELNRNEKQIRDDQLAAQYRRTVCALKWPS